MKSRYFWVTLGLCSVFPFKMVDDGEKAKLVEENCESEANGCKQNALNVTTKGDSICIR